MKIKLVDIDNRLSIKYNKIDGIYNWGIDNCYPQLVKSLINSSVTAKQCVKLNSKYIYGKGFEFTQDTTNKKSLVVNKRGLNINQLLRVVSLEFAEQNNVFLHVNYNALYEVISVDLLSSEDVRIGKADSTGYSGKFVVYDNWDKSVGKKIEKKDFNLIDKYNPTPAIIEVQVEVAGGWNKYKGQILHITADFNELYALSDINTVILDTDSQYKSAVYKNAGLSKGFFGAKLFTTKPFTDDSARRDFEKTINDLKGSENSSGVLLLEANDASDVLSEQMKIDNIDDNIEADKFQYVDISSKENVVDAFGIPAILVNQSDNSIFGNSGELIVQAKLMHWENNEEERSIITDAFELLFSNFHTPINPNNNWNITPIIQLNQPTNE